MIQGLRNLPYQDRLKHPNLHSLERRRVRGDLIEVFKWVKGFNKGDISKVLRITSQQEITFYFLLITVTKIVYIL